MVIIKCLEHLEWNEAEGIGDNGAGRFGEDQCADDDRSACNEEL